MIIHGENQMMKTMKRIENQSFERLRDRGGTVTEGYFVENCSFEGCAYCMTDDIGFRSVARDIILKNCRGRGLLVGPAIFEDLLIENLDMRELRIFGAVFKHVRLTGKLGSVMLKRDLSPVTATEAQQAAARVANARYYASVDWALDISQAEAKELDIEGIPVELIRRDLETQVIVTRERALAKDWKKIDLTKTYWETAIKVFLESRETACVLSATLS